jgi:hypothetical protein
MTDSHPDLGFRCECGSEICRHQVTGEDWRLPDLRQRYQGYFSPYLQRRIAGEQSVPVELPSVAAVAAAVPLPFVAFRKRARRAPEPVKLANTG